MKFTKYQVRQEYRFFDYTISQFSKFYSPQNEYNT